MTLYRLCERNVLPWYTIAGVEGRRFKRSDLEQLLQRGDTPKDN